MAVSPTSALDNPFCQGHCYVLTLYVLLAIEINDFFWKIRVVNCAAKVDAILTGSS